MSMIDAAHLLHILMSCIAVAGEGGSNLEGAVKVLRENEGVIVGIPHKRLRLAAHRQEACCQASALELACTHK